MSTAARALETVDRSRLSIFDSDEARANAAALAVMTQGLEDADLAAPAVVLPDFHHKPTMEMPSSIAVATLDTIRTTMTSSSVNCGMALVALDCQRPGEDQIADFYEGLRRRLPYPPSRLPVISAGEVFEAAVRGAEYAVDRHGLEPAALARIEEGGRLDLEPYGGARRLREELQWLVVQFARTRFGTIGPSNHFIELQRVEEVYHPHAAKLLGVEEGQITIQFHGGGGVLAGEVGAMFGRRRKRSRTLGAVMSVAKPLQHLWTARSRDDVRRRCALYFGGGCPPIPRASAEGERVMLANAAAMNYGFAFRQAAYAAIRRMATDCFGASSQLVVDSPHNSIYEEEVDGRRVIVHRHNAARAFTAARLRSHPVYSQIGQAILVPGTNRTSSYLCVAGDAAGQSLHSICHGAGSMVGDFSRSGRSGPDPQQRTTLRFRYGTATPQSVDHLDDAGIDSALSILQRNRLARPVARMRPFAVLN